ncbi:hypothetical protein [Bacillus clarus]|uniref:Uncharacterized protein n=1 Tax=Bacillus clarus TaxID=2338372 RepID=A0A090YTA6_9BACI|nr:hypothetical protein [Bacillus clarus]KFN01492.1 hypothetical protein DJ93_4598 [Bacillus clarus]
MADNFKLFGEEGMLGMDFRKRKVEIYNTDGYVVEILPTKKEVQEVINFLEECKEHME